MDNYIWLNQYKRQFEKKLEINEYLRGENEFDDNLLSYIDKLVDEVSEVANQNGLEIKRIHNLIRIYSRESQTVLLLIKAKYLMHDGRKEIVFTIEKHRTVDFTERYKGSFITDPKKWIQKFIEKIVERRLKFTIDFEKTYKPTDNSIIKVSPAISFSCRLCGGDGGATGNCPRCGGNGLEQE
ncbi:MULTISPECIES: hypothetical protein [unclassified Acinetobacter]|nr:MULTISPECIES: hypothetical protein [unclassified Acinetobacter]